MANSEATSNHAVLYSHLFSTYGRIYAHMYIMQMYLRSVTNTPNHWLLI